MQQSISVKPYDLEAGDRILGTPLVVAGRPHYAPTFVIDGQEYSADVLDKAGRWTVSLTNGSTITYGASRTVTVLREAV